MADGGWELALEFGDFAGPDGVAVDSRGDVYVLDVRNERVQVFTSEGKYLRETTGLIGATGIAIDEKDIIYILATYPTPPRCSYVSRWDVNLQYLGGWPSCIGEGDLQQGLGIDARDGLVYVGTVNSLIKFTTDGTLLNVWRVGGWKDVAIASDGTIWVSRNPYSGRGLVRHYTWKGEMLREWETILPDEKSSGPAGLDVDSRQRVFVSDLDNLRVKIFAEDGQPEDLIQVTFRLLLGLELDGDDIFYVGYTFTMPEGVMKFRKKLMPVEPATWGQIKARYRATK